ncbi:F-box/kelch-repeat protein At1g57790-like [Andrographis paniculata]|uniref:F-box/kelch-repeat protein At1g57790-like n=1 Tax=Andrographis paniculata TaxID=175694 RepID=UPI0021E8C365|nr:F-box/kelch-repeat protein At1g57790-like [Andrographis paniculata]
MKSSAVYYCKDDWILYFCLINRRHFLFHPYSGNTLSLPKLNQNSEVAAFSDTPTSPSCVVFSVTRGGGNTVCISTCHPTDKEWKNYEFNVLPQAVQFGFKQIAYYEGTFWCLNRRGYLGIFGIEKSAWSILPAPLAAQHPSILYTPKFIAAYEGNVYMVCSFYLKPAIYKLNIEKWHWDFAESLGELSYLANPVNSQIRAKVLGRRREHSIHFSKVLYHGKQIVTYSMSDRRFYPSKKCYDWEDKDAFQNVWIDAPEDTSVFL